MRVSLVRGRFAARVLQPATTGNALRCYSHDTPKYALIQGSSRGLGLEIVKQLLDRPNYR